LLISILVIVLESGSILVFLFSVAVRSLGESTLICAFVIIGSSSSQTQRYFSNVSATDLLTEINIY